MIRILKHGDRRRAVCPNCNCVFTYEQEDIKRVGTKINECELYYVSCPDCGVGYECPLEGEKEE